MDPESWCCGPKTLGSGWCRTLVGCVAVATLAVGCDESPTRVEPDSQATHSLADGSGGDLVTSNPEEFADALRRIGNENEVIVLLKDASVAPVAGDFLRELPLGADLVVAVRDVPAGTTLRRQPGLARAGAAAGEALMRVLRNHGIEPYRTDTQALALRIPDDKLVPVLAVLLHHPNVDYMEANQQRPITFNASPLGSNPLDIKHTFHNVDDAWGYTRGSGAKVGILDSGFAYNRGTGQWHSDGQQINTTTGIFKEWIRGRLPRGRSPIQQLHTK